MAENEIWPAIEYEESYPIDEDFAEIRARPFCFAHAALWLFEELPSAAENMPCYCEVVETVSDISETPIYRISFSTGGWSGAESITDLIESRADLSYFMQSWKRGGHYVFEIPKTGPFSPARLTTPPHQGE